MSNKFFYKMLCFPKNKFENLSNACLFVFLIEYIQSLFSQREGFNKKIL